MAVAEVIVVDNASRDGSAEVARRECPGARVLSLADNAGPCPARNRGMEEARTRLVLALDADLVLEPDCLERLLAAFERDPGLAVAEPRALDEGSGAVQYDGARFHYTGLLTLRNFYVERARAEGRGVVEVDAFVSVAALVDRAKCLAAGGYDPAFFILFEDSDLSYRLRSAGERIVCVEEAIVRHRGGTAGTSFRGGRYPARRVFLHARNRWLFLAKSYQWGTLLRGLPGLLVYEAASLVFACGKLAPHSWLLGKLAFFGGLPGALAARRETARRRRVPDRDFVGSGALTLWPPLTAGGASAFLGRALDATLRALWIALGGRP